MLFPDIVDLVSWKWTKQSHKLARERESMRYDLVHLGEITINLDTRRKPLNKWQREAIRGEGRYPYIGANGIVDYVDQYLFAEKILCVAEDGGYWGAGETCAFLYEEKCWVGNHAHVLAETPRARLEYVRYYLNHADLSKWVTGATRGKLTKSDLEQIELPLPQIPEQERLIAVFQEAEALVQKRTEALALLEQLQKAVFLEYFGDLLHSMQHNEMAKLGDLCDVRDGTHESPAYVQEGFPLITSRCLAEGDIDFRAAKQISESDFHEINRRSQVDQGDILLPMIGTIGNPVIVMTDVPFAIKNVALLKFAHAQKVTNRYVKGYLASPHFSRWVESMQRGGTQRFVSLTDLRSLPVPLPPLARQLQYGQADEQIERQKRDMKAQLAALQAQFHSILYRAFRGEPLG